MQLSDNSWIRTYSGKKFYPLNPEPNKIDIIDIAHALSNVCRYTGHCNSFYSVAEHSYYVSQYAGIEGLMHDAPEAYIADFSKPIKHLISNYKDIESNLEKVIFQKFNLQFPLPGLVKEFDDKLLHTEMSQIMNGADFDKNLVLDLKIQGWRPEKAEAMFLSRFYKLAGI